MNTPDDFSQYYAKLLDRSYDCVDRILLNAFFLMGQTGGGMGSWWRNLYGGRLARRTTMNEVYQKLIYRTRAPSDLKQVRTIFGFSHRRYHRATRGRQSAQVVKAVEAPPWEVKW